MPTATTPDDILSIARLKPSTVRFLCSSYGRPHLIKWLLKAINFPTIIHMTFSDTCLDGYSFESVPTKTNHWGFCRSLSGFVAGWHVAKVHSDAKFLYVDQGEPNRVTLVMDQFWRANVCSQSFLKVSAIPPSITEKFESDMLVEFVYDSNGMSYRMAKNRYGDVSMAWTRIAEKQEVHVQKRDIGNLSKDEVASALWDLSKRKPVAWPMDDLLKRYEHLTGRKRPGFMS